MGLASKLAAAQGAQGGAPVANYTAQQSRPGGPGGGYPGQQYQAYPGGAPQQTPSMPLAAKMAATQGAGAPSYPPSLQPGYGQQSYGQQSYGQQQYSRPPPSAPQQSQGMYPGQAPPTYGQPQGYPPQQGYYGGAPPQQQGGYGQPPPQSQYGGPPPVQQQYAAGAPMGAPGAGPGDARSYQRELERAVQEQELQAFYGPGTPGGQRIPQIAQRAAQQVDRLCQAWRIQREIANDIVRLALYDVIIYIDDSGSMSFEENGERIKDLQLIIQRAAFAATLFDEDGIDVRFMNDDSIPPNMLNGIRSEPQVEQLMANKRYKGLTPFGTELRKKVIDPILIPRLRGQMQKPLLVISITDGQPAGENQNELVETVRYAVTQARQSRYGQGAIAFQFAQVGNDQKATDFLAKLDNDPMVGREVDCTSNYENESEEMSRANPPIDLTPDLWMMKLILGAIDPSYDTKDEKTNMAPGMGMPPQGRPGGGYGGPAPPSQGGYGGGYGGGQPSYGGAPPPGQSGYGAAPSGGYQQGSGYNRPPPQQGGYGGGAPPQPPRY